MKLATILPLLLVSQVQGIDVDPNKVVDTDGSPIINHNGLPNLIFTGVGASC